MPESRAASHYSDPVRQVHRGVLFVIFVLVLIIGALSSLAVTTVRSAYPQTSGELNLPGLQGRVQVVRNDHGVADIYAGSASDLFAAQGFVHAQDRFWQMDFRRHVTAGRLSELFGASQVETDTVIRTLGWRRVAEQELPLLSADTRRNLEAYADGVNAYLRVHSTTDLAVEYNVLGLTGLDYDPADWTAVDSLAWLKAMAWELSGNADTEIERALLTPRLGEKQVARLYPVYDHDRFEPIVGQGALVDGAFDPDARAGSGRPPVPESEAPAAEQALHSAARSLDAMPRLLGGDDQAIGSNSFAISGSRTSTGAAILGNDPHLATGIPSVFQQMGLHCTTVGPECPYDVSGFTFAGMPGVIIGHNQQISWGLTTSYLDVQDLYLEEVRGDQVRVNKSWQPLQRRTEEIRIKGESEPKRITVRSSRHGPLMSDVDDRYRRAGSAGRSGYAVALSWTALTPRNTMDAIFAIDRAENFTDFRKAAAQLAAPSQNLIYADREGNIGYQLPGDTPIRGKGDGSSPAPGWDPAYDWKGLIDFEAMPYSYNPPSGYLVAANQSVTADYPYRLTADQSYGWRSQALVERIDDLDEITPADAEDLFYDDRMLFADALVPALVDVQLTDRWVAEGQQVLKSWDRRASVDSAGAAFFNVVISNVLRQTFDDQLPADLRPSAGDRWYAVLAELIEEPNDPWWDDIRTRDVVETRDDILVSAMTAARKEITALMSRDTVGWQWGKVHRVTLRHEAFGEVDGVRRIFNRGDHPVSGGGAVVNAMAFDDREDFSVRNGPTMRMLINWDNLDGSRWINQSGNSGHAYHRNYDDQLPLWATERMLPFRSSPEAVRRDGVATLTLLPV